MINKQKKVKKIYSPLKNKAMSGVQNIQMRAQIEILCYVIILLNVDAY